MTTTTTGKEPAAAAAALRQLTRPRHPAAHADVQAKPRHTRSFASPSEIVDALKSDNAEALYQALAQLRRQLRNAGDDAAGAATVDDGRRVVIKYLEQSKNCDELFGVWLFQRKGNVNRLEVIILDVFTRVLREANNVLTKSTGLAVAKKIIRSFLSTIYRNLSSGNVALCQATLRLLTAVVAHGGSVVRELKENFNFGIKAMHKLASIRRKPNQADAGSQGVKAHGVDTRTLYVQFVLSFFRYGDAAVKKDILEVKDLVSSIFKGLHQDDYELVDEVLSVFKNHLLLDVGISRFVKESFFGAYVLENVARLYPRRETVESKTFTSIAALAHDFLVFVCCTPDVGVWVQDSGWYTAQPALGLSENKTPHVGRNNHVHNRTLAKFLQCLRPTDDVLQQELVLAILQACPELYQVYWQSSSLSFEPRLSAKWLANMGFFQRAAALPVPSFALPGPDGSAPVYPLLPPPVSVAADNVFPPVVQRRVLGKGLQHTSSLVRHVTAGAVATALRRLSLVLRQLRTVADSFADGEDGDSLKSAAEGQAKWKKAAALVADEVRRRAPDAQILLAMQHSVIEEEKKNGAGQGVDGKDDYSNSSVGMLHEDVLRLIKHYLEVLPEAFRESNFDFGKLLPLDIGRVSPGLQLHLVELLRNLPSFDWTGRSANSRTNHLTKLVDLHLSTPSLTVRKHALAVVEHSLGESAMFEHDPSEVAVWVRALRRSAVAGEKEEALRFFDACLERASKNPYKYFDELAGVIANVRRVEGMDKGTICDVAVEGSVGLARILAKARCATRADVPGPVELGESSRRLPFSPLLACVVEGICEMAASGAPSSGALGFLRCLITVLLGTQVSPMFLLEYVKKARSAQVGAPKAAAARSVLENLQMTVERFAHDSAAGNAAATDFDCPSPCGSDSAMEQFVLRLAAAPDATAAAACGQLLFRMEQDRMPDAARLIVMRVSARLLSGVPGWTPAMMEMLDLVLEKSRESGAGAAKTNAATVQTVFGHPAVIGVFKARLADEAEASVVSEMKSYVCSMIHRFAAVGFGEKTDRGYQKLTSWLWVPYKQTVLDELLQQVSGTGSDADTASVSTETVMQFAAIAPLYAEEEVGCVFDAVFELAKVDWSPGGTGYSELRDGILSAVLSPRDAHGGGLPSLPPRFRRMFSVLSAGWKARPTPVLDDLMVAMVRRCSPPLLSYGNYGFCSNELIETAEGWFASDAAEMLDDAALAEQLLSGAPTAARARMLGDLVIVSRKCRRAFCEFVCNADGAIAERRRDERVVDDIRSMPLWWIVPASRALVIAAACPATPTGEAAWLESAGKFERDAVGALSAALAPRLAAKLARGGARADDDGSTLRLLQWFLDLAPPSNPEPLIDAVIAARPPRPTPGFFRVAAAVFARPRPKLSRRAAELFEAAWTDFLAVLEPGGDPVDVLDEEDVRWMYPVFAELDAFLLRLNESDIKFTSVASTRFVRNVLKHCIGSCEALQVVRRVMRFIPAIFLSSGPIIDELANNPRFSELMGAGDARVDKATTGQSLVRRELCQLIHALFTRDVSSCGQSRAALLFRHYAGTTCAADRHLLASLLAHERHAGGSGMMSAALTFASAGAPARDAKDDAAKAREAAARIDPGRMAHLVAHFPAGFSVSANGEEEIAEAGGDLSYDPRFFLPLVAHLANHGVDPRALLECNGIGLAVVALSSTAADTRRVGYFVLDLFYKLLENATFREYQQVSLLFESLRHAVTDRYAPQRVPGPVAVFVAQASSIVLRPEHALYPLINRFLLQRPLLDLEDLPMFYKLLDSSSATRRFERTWLLRLLTSGLRSDEDYQLFKRRHALDLVIGHVTSSMGDAGLRRLAGTYLERLAEVPAAACDAVQRSGLLTVLGQLAISFFPSVRRMPAAGRGDAGHAEPPSLSADVGAQLPAILHRLVRTVRGSLAWTGGAFEMQVANLAGIMLGSLTASISGGGGDDAAHKPPPAAAAAAAALAGLRHVLAAWEAVDGAGFAAAEAAKAARVVRICERAVVDLADAPSSPSELGAEWKRAVEVLYRLVSRKRKEAAGGAARAFATARALAAGVDGSARAVVEELMAP